TQQMIRPSFSRPSITVWFWVTNRGVAKSCFKGPVLTHVLLLSRPPFEFLATVGKLFCVRMCVASDHGALPGAYSLGFDFGCLQYDFLIHLRVVDNSSLHALPFGSQEFSHLLDFGH